MEEFCSSPSGTPLPKQRSEHQPDYARCVDISTRAAIREMLLPGLIAIASPVAVGLLLGKAALAGLLAGATVTGVLLAIMMANSGGAWDNARTGRSPASGPPP